jgi:hypothetical protein
MGGGGGGGRGSSTSEKGGIGRGTAGTEAQSPFTVVSSDLCLQLGLAGYSCYREKKDLRVR